MTNDLTGLVMGFGTTAVALGLWSYIRKAKHKARRFILRYEHIEDKFR